MNWPLDLFGLKYNFVGWTGDVKTSSLKFDVAMNQPKTVSANYSADYTPLILPIAITIAVVGSLAVFFLGLDTLLPRSRPSQDRRKAHRPPLAVVVANLLMRAGLSAIVAGPN